MSAQPSLNFRSPEFIANPYPAFAALRNQSPVVWVERGPGFGGWFITGYDEVLRVLKDPRFAVSEVEASSAGISPFGRMPLGLEHSMVRLDGSAHDRLRSLVSRGFTPHFIEGLRPRIQEIADSLLDHVEAQGQMDLVTDYAFPLPINVISEMLGVPKADQTQIGEWSNGLSDMTSGGASAERFAKLDAFAAYIAALIEAKRQSPQDDLISKLIVQSAAGDKLNATELNAMVGLLIFAGHETTSNLIGNGMMALFMHPAQFERLKANPALIPSAIEELLRFCGPALSTGPRFAVEDVEIGGKLIRKGQMVNVILAAADRDPEQFIEPDDLDIARQIDRHLAFGQGVHYCLGAPLARLEGHIAFETLLRRLPNIHLTVPPESVAWRGGLVLRGPQSIPVAF